MPSIAPDQWRAGASTRFGVATAAVTTALTVITSAVAVATPPASGPFCLNVCLGYPYLDVAARFPRDYWWMIPACVLCLAVVAMLAALHELARPERKVWSLMALTFGAMGSAILFADYFVQLAVMQPSVLAGEEDGLALVSQYNPHGIFIALEEAGYLLWALALGCAAPALSRIRGFARVARGAFTSAFPLALFALVGVLIVYGPEREYRYEVAVIVIDWLTLIVGSGALAMHWLRGGAGPASASETGDERS